MPREPLSALEIIIYLACLLARPVPRSLFPHLSKEKKTIRLLAPGDKQVNLEADNSDHKLFFPEGAGRVRGWGATASVSCVSEHRVCPCRRNQWWRQPSGELLGRDKGFGLRGSSDGKGSIINFLIQPF